MIVGNDSSLSCGLMPPALPRLPRARRAVWPLPSTLRQRLAPLTVRNHRADDLHRCAIDHHNIRHNPLTFLPAQPAAISIRELP
eukprot:g28271.t1